MSAILQNDMCIECEVFLFTHNRHLKKCLVDYGTRVYADWVLAHPGQAVLTVVSSTAQRFLCLGHKSY